MFVIVQRIHHLSNNQAIWQSYCQEFWEKLISADDSSSADPKVVYKCQQKTFYLGYSLLSEACDKMDTIWNTITSDQDLEVMNNNCLKM